MQQLTGSCFVKKKKKKRKNMRLVSVDKWRLVLVDYENWK